MMPWLLVSTCHGVVGGEGTAGFVRIHLKIKKHHSETRNQNVRTVAVVVVKVHERDPNNAPKASLVFKQTQKKHTSKLRSIHPTQHWTRYQ
jgi:hypothetical protein